MAAQEGSIEEVTEETTTPAPPRPKFGRGLSRRYSLYPSKSSLGTVRGALTAAIDIVKFLYTNEFTRFVYLYTIYCDLTLLYSNLINHLNICNCLIYESLIFFL